MGKQKKIIKKGAKYHCGRHNRDYWGRCPICDIELEIQRTLEVTEC